LIKLTKKSATAKNFPQRNEKTAQLCGKTAQLATLKRSQELKAARRLIMRNLNI